MLTLIQLTGKAVKYNLNILAWHIKLMKQVKLTV